MPTYNDLSADILSTAGYTHDDAKRSKNSILFNIGIAIDRLKRERLEKGLRNTGSRGLTQMLTTFLIPVNYESTLNGRGYFDLPGQVYDIQQNGGIDYIVYNRASGCKDNLVGKHFSLTSPSAVDGLYHSVMQRPRPELPYYYRGRYNDGTTLYTDRVWLMGIASALQSVEVGLYLTVGDILIKDPDEEIDLPPDMVLLVKNMVLSLERWAMAVPEESLKNDGRDRPVGWSARSLPPTTVSVNAPSLNEQ
jgi:hypothetical protein